RMARKVQRATESGQPATRWREGVAAAVLLLAVGWVGGGSEPLGRSVEVVEATVWSAPTVATTSSIHGASIYDASIYEAASWNNLDNASMPLFEEIGEPYQQVVQWSDENLSVVLVVDERFDV
ncbi:MAG: hypothetical protein K8J08_05910, partial [Thermoanaerobaculia bacterium]|nr:hypothetical protein [Thermoanaerobaculia bacterium]